tara:strand:- start:1882 stop:2085 length:204 start_codon:yes stop_codon:yes gene_type:complete
MEESNVTSMVEENGTEESKATMNVGDIQTMITIIDLASQRGAFRAPELKSIGEYYEKLSSFIPKETK